jgi:nucleotide-binding universal stress UspA family protein
VELLVIGMKRRSPVGKAVLGSISQRLLLDAPVAVLAVKTGAATRSPVPAG